MCHLRCIDRGFSHWRKIGVYMNIKMRGPTCSIADSSPPRLQGNFITQTSLDQFCTNPSPKAITYREAHGAKLRTHNSSAQNQTQLDDAAPPLTNTVRNLRLPFPLFLPPPSRSQNHLPLSLVHPVTVQHPYFDESSLMRVRPSIRTEERWLACPSSFGQLLVMRATAAAIPTAAA